MPDPASKPSRDRQAPSACSPPPSSSSTSPAWSRARPRVKAWATSSSPTSARDRCHRPRGALLRGRERHPRRQQASTPSPTTSRSSTELELTSPTVDSCEKAAEGRTTRQGGESEDGRRAMLEKLIPTSARARRRAAWTMSADEKPIKRPHLPHQQAGDVRRQRRRGRLREQPAPRGGGQGHRRKKAPIRRAVCARSRPRSPPGRRRREADVPRDRASKSRPRPRDPRRLPLLNLQTFFTAGRQGSAAPGPSASAPPPPQPPASSTPTSRKASSAPKTIAYDDFIQYKGEAGAAKPARWRPEQDYIVQGRRRDALPLQRLSLAKPASAGFVCPAVTPKRLIRYQFIRKTGVDTPPGQENNARHSAT